MLAWLTPEESPGIFSSRVILIPANPEYLWPLLGALQLLCEPHNWEEFGAQPVDSVVQVYEQIFDSVYALSEAGESMPFSGARVFQSAGQVMPNGAYAWVTFDSESYDTDGFHDAVNPTRLTVPSDGVYLLSFQYGWTAVINAVTDWTFTKNRAVNLGRSYKQSWHYYDSAHAIAPLAAGEYVEISLYQASGAPAQFNVTPQQSCYFSISKIGEL